MPSIWKRIGGRTSLATEKGRPDVLEHIVASTGVIVDAKDAAAVTLYKKYEFLELPNVERRLFMPMGTIAALFK